MTTDNSVTVEKLTPDFQWRFRSNVINKCALKEDLNQ